jgi:cysteinyl-tRNA synthetase
MLKFHNTLSGQIEEFQPLKNNEVRMYIYGSTVWNFARSDEIRNLLSEKEIG